jgi:hypothetical protein
MEEEFEYIKFMQNHNLTIDDLPIHIKYPVAGFNTTHWSLNDIDDEIEEDRIREELKEIDGLILEELEEEFDELLSATEINTNEKVSKEQLNSEETLLDHLVERGRTKNIGRSELRDMGMETRIKNNTIIGKYILKKESLFYHRYNIQRLKEE